MQQGTEEWLKWRMGGIGASEVAAVLGICPYQTPLDLFNVKTGRSRGFEGNSATQRGHELEGRARARYELFNMEDMPPAVASHPKFEICRASFDGLSSDRKRILEIKCPGKASHDLAKSGKIPEHYWPQVQYQLAVAGAEVNDYFSYSDTEKSHALIHVAPDVAYQGLIIAKVLEFWEKHIMANHPPPHTERDVKFVNDNPKLEVLAQMILEEASSDKPDKKLLDLFKADFVGIGFHPKVRCGQVQVSTVKRAGKFSYHKLTIHEVTP